MRLRLSLALVCLAACAGSDELSTVGQGIGSSVPPPGNSPPIPPAPPAIDFTRAGRRLTTSTQQPMRAFDTWNSSTLDITDFWQRSRTAFRLTTGSQLVQQSVVALDRGRKRYRYQQTHGGVPVEDATYALSTIDGRVVHGQGYTAPDLALSTTPAVAQATAVATANTLIGATQLRAPAHAQLAVYSPDFGKLTPFKLVWTVDLAEQAPHFESHRVHVDAQTGIALDDVRREHHDLTATGKGADGVTRTFTDQQYSTSPPGYSLRSTSPTHVATRYRSSGQLFDFTDSDNVWNEISNNNFGVSAHWAAQKTWGWLASEGPPGPSIVTSGSAITVVEVFNDPFTCDGTHYDPGDGVVYLCNLNFPDMPDVDLESVAHEIGHLEEEDRMGGFDPHVAEADALSEHIGDVIAASVSFSVSGNVNDWVLFDDGDPDPLRRHMKDPGLDVPAAPSFYHGAHWNDVYPDGHALGGVGNRWFYLLAMGGGGINEVGRSYAVHGIGRAAAARLVLASLRDLSPRSGYTDYAAATVHEAESIYGEHSSVYEAVVAAWTAVGVITDPPEPYRVPERGETGVVAWPTELSFAVPLCTRGTCPVEMSWQIQLSTSPDFSTGNQTIVTSSTRTNRAGDPVAFTSLNLAVGTIYYWRARPRYHDLTWGDWAWSSVFETSRMAPHHAAPADADGYYPWDAVFSCDAIPNATAYQFEISRHSDLSEPYTTTKTDCWASIDLSPDADYWWRVRAVGPAGGGYGEWASFYQGQGLDPPPTLDDLERPWQEENALSFTTGEPHFGDFYPENASLVIPWYVELEWDQVWGATSYDLQISVDDPTFTPPLYDDEPAADIASKKINVEPILSRKYYWRVRGVGHGGKTEWSNDGDPEKQYFQIQPESTLPACLGPGSDHEVTASSVTLAWSYVPFATYHVTVTEQGASSPAYSADTGNARTVQIALAPGKSYSYRVHTTGPDGIDGENTPNGGDCTFRTKAAPPPPLPCGTIAQAGGNLADTRTYELGVNHGTMHLHWRTFAIKDEIIVKYGNSTLWDECVSSPDPYNAGSAGNGAEQDHVMSFSGSSTQVTIEVQPGCDPSQSSTTTQWDYQMDCP